MSRSRNNTDKLVDLLFYVFPEYMDEYNNQNYSKRRHRKREGLRDEEREGLRDEEREGLRDEELEVLRDEELEGFRDEMKGEIFKKFKSLAFNDDNHNVKSEHKEGNAKKVQGDPQVRKNNDDELEGFRKEMKGEIFKKFKSVAFNEDKHNVKSEHREGNAKKVQGDPQIRKNNTDDDKHNVKSEHKEGNTKKVQGDSQVRKNNDDELEGFRKEMKGEIFKKFKSVAFNEDKHNVKSEHREGNAKKVQGNSQVRKNNTDDDKHNVKSEHKENNAKKVQDNHKLRKNNIDRNNIEEKHTEDDNRKCNKFGNECKNCKGCNAKKVQDNYQVRKNNTERNITKEDTEDGNDKYNKFNEDKKSSDFNLSNNEKISDKEADDKFIKESYIYNDELQFEKVLRVLINKKISIVISDPIRSVIYNVIILEVSSDTVKLKTETNTIIVLCIKEIVAIQCDEKDYVNFVKNVWFNKNEDYGGGGLQSYLYSIIGKRVFIQTKGNADFRHINCKKITAVGEAFVVIEDSIIISLCKIILIEEIECYKENS